MATLWAVIREDRKHNRRTWTSPGTQALVAYRLARWVREHRTMPGAWVLGKCCALLGTVVRHRFGIAVSPSADIGRRVIIQHQGGIVVGENVRLGDECVIRQGVRIGCFTTPGDGRRGPTIGRRAEIGARAVVDGPVRVGPGARIGPNAVVTADVAANTLVIAPPSSVQRPPTASAERTAAS